MNEIVITLFCPLDCVTNSRVLLKLAEGQEGLALDGTGFIHGTIVAISPTFVDPCDGRKSTNYTVSYDPATVQGGVLVCANIAQVCCFRCTEEYFENFLTQPTQEAECPDGNYFVGAPV